MTDPYGEDAIYVEYKGYPVTIPGSRRTIPAWHAAVIAVDETTGRTKYFEYGRYDSDFGQVKQRVVPDVQMDKETKLPTKESLRKLYDFVSARYGKHKPVHAEYYCDSKYEKVVAFALGRMHDPKRKAYSWVPPRNTCDTFAREAVEAGRK